MRHCKHHLLFVMKATAQFEWWCCAQVPPIIFTLLMGTWPLSYFISLSFLNKWQNLKLLLELCVGTLHAPAVTVSRGEFGYNLKQEGKIYVILVLIMFNSRKERVKEWWCIILTLPTSTGSGPVYSSMTKNWFHTHPRLDLWSTWPSLPPLCLCRCSDKWPASTKMNANYYLSIFCKPM